LTHKVIAQAAPARFLKPSKCIFYEMERELRRTWFFVGERKAGGRYAADFPLQLPARLSGSAAFDGPGRSEDSVGETFS
jgi:hypothetical protein